MVQIGYANIYIWDEKEKAAHNTERHQIFVDELYIYAQLPNDAFSKKLAEFKDNNFDLIK